jgi:hypothetical protein
LGVGQERLKFRVAIHETADAAAAVRWWAAAVDAPLDRFLPSTIKRHRVRTGRHNTGSDYHGCLVVSVSRSRRLYWTIEGTVAGLVAEAAARPDPAGPRVVEGVPVG